MQCNAGREPGGGRGNEGTTGWGTRPRNGPKRVSAAAEAPGGENVRGGGEGRRRRRRSRGGRRSGRGGGGEGGPLRPPGCSRTRTRGLTSERGAPHSLARALALRAPPSRPKAPPSRPFSRTLRALARRSLASRAVEKGGGHPSRPRRARAPARPRCRVSRPAGDQDQGPARWVWACAAPVLNIEGAMAPTWGHLHIARAPPRRH